MTLLELQEKLGNGFECFSKLSDNELWEDHFNSLLALVKDYVVNI